MNSDYGMHLIEIGFGKVIQYMYGVGFDHLAVVGPRMYSTTVNCEVGGVVYAASYDYDTARLAELMSLADQHVRQQVAIAIRDGGWAPREIGIGDPLFVNVRARVGEPVKVETETFAPMKVEAFFL